MTQIIADVSKHQGAIDHEKLAGKVDGVIVRACFGKTKDILFEENYAGLAPLTGVSAYIYVTTTSSAASQAAAIIAAIAGKQVKYVVIDCEENISGWSKAALAAHYKAIIDAIEAARPDVEIVIYTRGAWWNTYVGNPSWAGNYKLMIARYPIQHPWADNPALYRPLPWLDYWAWQLFADNDNWGAAYGAASDDIDISIVNPYRAIPAPNQPPPPVPPVPPAPPADCDPLPTLTVLTATLNIRSGPGTGYADIGDLHFGDVVTVYVIVTLNSASVWVKIDPGAEKWCAVVYGGVKYLA